MLLDKGGGFLKVLHINCNYIGTTLHQKMIEHLEENNISNEVFVPTYDKEKSVIKVRSNVVVSECFKKDDRVFFLNKSRKIYNSLTEKMDIEKFDLIHAYTLFTDGNVAREIKRKFGIPYVVAVRNTDVNFFFKYMLNLRGRGMQILADASAVFFLSDAYKNQVLDKYIPHNMRESIRKKTHVIPNGIDDFWLKNCWKDEKRIIHTPIKLIYAGRIDRNKNIETIQKTVQKLNELGQKATLTVVGKVDDEKIYKKIARDCNTKVLDPVEKEKLINLYRNNDIFIMPSFHETFGLVYAEAMSQGLPVLYTKGQGFDDQFSEGVVGFSVNPHNILDIVNKTKKIITNYLEISNRCSRLVVKFSWNNIAREYVEIYENIIKK